MGEITLSFFCCALKKALEMDLRELVSMLVRSNVSFVEEARLNVSRISEPKNTSIDLYQVVQKRLGP